MKLLTEEMTLDVDTPDNIDLGTRVRVDNTDNDARATVTQKDDSGNVIGTITLSNVGPAAFVFLDKAPTDTLESDSADVRFLKVSAFGVG